MRKLNLTEMVMLSVGLSARIEQLEKFYATTYSEYLKNGYLQEIKKTKKLRDLIDKTDLYTEWHAERRGNVDRQTVTIPIAAHKERK